MDDCWSFNTERREQWELLSGSALPLPVLNTTSMDADAHDHAIEKFYNTRSTSATYPAGRAFATATAVGVVEGSSTEEGAGQCAGYLFGGAAVVLASWRAVHNMKFRLPILPLTDPTWQKPWGQLSEAVTLEVPEQTSPVAFNDLWRYDCLANGSIAWARVLPASLAGRAPGRRFTNDVGNLRGDKGWPSSRYHHAAWVIGGQLYVFGGLGTGPDRSTLELADLWQCSPGGEKEHCLTLHFRCH